MTHDELLAKMNEPNPAGLIISELATELAREKEHYIVKAFAEIGINPQVVIEQEALINQLKAQLRAVVKLHTAGNGEASRCEACYLGFDCPTKEAIEKALS